MSTIVLSLPTSFNIPSEYLHTTQEENAAILLLGRSLLVDLRKTNFTERINQLNKELNEERLANDRFRETLDNIDNLITTTIDEAVDRSFIELTKKVEVLNRTALDHDKTAREVNLNVVLQERNNIEKRVSNIAGLLDRVSDLANRTATEAGIEQRNFRSEAAVRGRENEINSRQIIVDAFGSVGTDFCIHPKEDFSGDHIFEWNGLRIMWEDKKYTKPVPREEIEKAWRDLAANVDCHALLFVSANTPIVTRESSTGLVSEVRDGRLILYLSSFKNNVDQIGYLRTVIQTILLACKPLLLRERELGSEVVDERLRLASTVLTSLSQSLLDQEKACDSLITDMRVRLTSMKNGIDRTKHGIESLVNDLITTDQPAVSEVTKTVRKCGRCGQPGHTIRTCKD